MRKITEIIVHCSATEHNENYGVAQIRKWHMTKGWKDCGYHYVIKLDGTIEIGRPIEQIGAHCKGHNRNSIGICYIGGLYNSRPCDTRTTFQRNALRSLIKRLHVEYPSIISVEGHRVYANKACPCFDAHKEYSYLLNDNIK